MRADETEGRADAGGATPALALSADQLYRAADLSQLKFSTTADLDPLDGTIGQQRALDAVQVGTGLAKPGFNLFVIGPHGAGMQQAVEARLKTAARASPPDWVYVNNFSDPQKPIAIQLPAGEAPKFRDAMRELIEDLKTALPAAFESEDYQTRRGAIDEEFQKRQADAFSVLRDRAAGKEIAILRTPLGFALAPMRKGTVVPPEEFNAWPEAQRRETQQAIEALEGELERVMRQVPQWEKERRDEIRKLNRETAKFAVGQSIEETKARLQAIPRVVSHLEAVHNDLVENAGMFIAAKGEDGADATIGAGPGGPFDRYEVNVLVTQAGRDTGAPIVEELHPTLGNLIGKIEYIARQGVLGTNFRLIRAGAMHRANGGYLLLDVRNVLMEPFSWAALKRALKRREIVIEDAGRFLGLSSTVTLEPDPIPFDAKVILFGDRILYYLLAAFDPELSEHFKVLADFEDDLKRSPENETVLARLVASIVRQQQLKPVDRDGVALVIEHAARLADHSGRLTLIVDRIRDILTEADFWAKDASRSEIARADIQRALEAQIRRAARLRDRTQELVLQNVALIDTTGTRVGQVNGLSVFELGGFRFGHPTRITSRARPGTGKVVDIEREVELGGPIHSKGVLILSGFLAGRYALDTPMSLFASLVFEQSYGGVEGDSASAAELFALMSALAEAPLRQDVAVTGSVNQHGQIQAIGGVNEKIEGFFDICKARGLSGTQGVIIPQANVQHLMLRRDVVEACAEGKFAVYPIKTIDQGIALLSGLPAGERGADGAFPEGSINRLVEDRLRAFAMIRRSFVEHQRPSTEAQ
jgi:lon-related putative ATP-dependent protease